MYIEDSELKELLEKQRKSTERKHFPIEAFLSLGAFILSALMAQIFSQSLWLKILVWGFVGLNLIYVSYLLLNYLKKKYSENDLLKDIKDSNRIRYFSLLVLKDKSGTFKDKYLLRYDKRWKTWLLPYRETHEENDEKFICDYIQNVLCLKDFSILQKKEDDIEKYSVSDQMTKKYHHTFYFIEFDASSLKEKMKINDDKFKWFSIDQMKRTKSIESKNSETIRFVAKNFILF